MRWELSKGGERRKATSRIPLEILLRSCSSSEVVVESSKSQDEGEKYRRSFNDDEKKREGGYFSRDSRSLLGFIFILSLVSLPM